MISMSRTQATGVSCEAGKVLLISRLLRLRCEDDICSSCVLPLPVCHLYLRVCLPCAFSRWVAAYSDHIATYPSHVRPSPIPARPASVRHASFRDLCRRAGSCQPVGRGNLAPSVCRDGGRCCQRNCCPGHRLRRLQLCGQGHACS